MEKRIIVVYIVIRFIKEDFKLKIKIVKDKDVVFEDLKIRFLIIIFIYNLVKIWFIFKYNDEIIGFLL